MEVIFKPMEMSMAEQIANWIYPEPYQVYSMDGSDECITELLDGEYYCGLDSKDQITGYICTGHTARVPGGYAIGLYEDNSYVDFGLGLAPALTGMGNGASFVSAGLRFLEQKGIKRFRLVVASFNTRAIKVYEENGFRRKSIFHSKVNGEDYEFFCMTIQ
jgi:ribosomal-protein-alanine N-acetyltransferase